MRQKLESAENLLCILHDFFVEIHDSADNDPQRVKRLCAEAMDMMDEEVGPSPNVSQEGRA